MNTWAGVVLAGLVLSLGGSAFGAEQQRDLPPFDRLAADGAFDIVVNAGKTQSVIVETARSHLDRIDTRVVDGELRVSIPGRAFDQSAILWITVPVMERVVLRGASDISMDGMNNDDFDLEIIGAGEAHLIGACGSLSVGIEGSGDVDAASLECEAVKVRVTGSGDVAVYASHAVSVRVSGSGNVDVYGHPRQVEQVALGGAASIRVR